MSTDKETEVRDRLAKEFDYWYHTLIKLEGFEHENVTAASILAQTSIMLQRDK